MRVYGTHTRAAHAGPAIPGLEILRCEVGSSLHGLALDDQDDLDLMGITVEPPEHVTGTGRFDQVTWRTQPEGSRSGPGDIDLVVYGLRKWMRLALAGNPTVLLLLFAPYDKVHRAHDLGRELREEVFGLILSRACAPRFHGYLCAQLDRATGTGKFSRGAREGARDPQRLAKYLSHVLRLGYQGVELLSTGTITLPLPSPEREFCRAVKRGEVGTEKVLVVASQLQARLAAFSEGDAPSPLPAEPDRGKVQRWMHHAYQQGWLAQDALEAIRRCG